MKMEIFVCSISVDKKGILWYHIFVKFSVRSAKFENHTYTVSKDAIPQGAIIVLTVEKTLAVNISVNHYLTLGGGQNLYLILNTVDQTDGMIYRYGDTAMFWSDAYGAYCTLILASSAPEIDDIYADIGWRYHRCCG